jgi:hypothetical protein
VDQIAQAALNEARAVSVRYPPAAAFMKLLLAEVHRLPAWPLKPPLMPLPPAVAKRALLSWRTRGQIA